jgi:hypothetical protein
MNILKTLKAIGLRLITPQLSTILTFVIHLEAAIERTINTEVAKLSKMSQAAKDLDDAIKAKNATIDTAYKLLNKVSELSK